MLHLLNGDAVLPAFQASGLPGQPAVWGDVLWEGPLVPGSSRAAEIRARAAYFAGAGNDPTPLVALQEAWDAGLAAAAAHEEVVLWLEHDLHDQFQLLRHLDHFARQPHARLSLICIGAFPGVDPFHGLGQLDGAQLAGLLPARRPVTPAQLALAQEGWAAVRQPTPVALAELLQRDTAPFPFLAGAIRRFLEEFPAPTTGLSRTEATILDALLEGPRSAATLFAAVARREERVFMGDWSFARILHGLAEGPAALVRIENGPADAPLSGTVSLTPTGRQVLEGAADRVSLLGIDRWLGGTRLLGRAVAWRWDRTAGRLVA